MRRITSISLVFSTLLLISISSAQEPASTAVPNLIRYSGTLKDAQGSALSSPTAVGVTFSIYKQQDGGAPVWMETQNVTPDAGGQYSVLLGSTTATGLPSDLFSQEEQRWLGVQVQGQAEQPRVLLVSVPYAFKAHEAETLGGLPASAFVKAAPTDTSSNGSNGSALNALSNAGSAGGTSTTKGKTASGKPKRSAPCATIGGGGTLNFIPLWTPDGCTLGDSLLSQLTAGRVDVNGNLDLASTSSAYQIGASNVLSIGSSADDNLFLGLGAGTSNVAGSGQYNVFSGYQAGYSNTTGNRNTFVGYQAGLGNTSGVYNTFTGEHAGRNNTRGSFNTFSGAWAGYNNTAGSYNTFSGESAGQQNTTGSNNTFSGTSAGYSNTTGYSNTFSGTSAGHSNTTGYHNTFSGELAGYSNTQGWDNTFFGYWAGYSNTTGLDNTFFGRGTGYSSTTGSFNAFYGSGAGFWNTTGSDNTFSGGRGAGFSNTTGNNNTFYGDFAGYGNTTGSGNTFNGYYAGYNNTTGNNNIYIGNRGSDSGRESNTIRLGTQGTGDGQQKAAYVAGINGATTNSGVPVFVDATGKLGTTGGSLGGVTSFNGRTGAVVPTANDYSFSQLGGLLGSSQLSGTYSNAVTLSSTANVFYGDGSHLTGTGGGCGSGSYYIRNGTSQPPNASLNISGTGIANGFTGRMNYRPGDSVRFKEQVRDMGDSTTALFKLRPVTSLNKPEYDKGTRTLQYGLIAEEVAKVYPELVANDNEGQPYTVRYQYLAPMLLNEMQKQYQQAEAEAKVITTQQDEINAQHRQIQDLQQRLSRLEALVAAQVKIAEGASPSAGTQ